MYQTGFINARETTGDDPLGMRIPVSLVVNLVANGKPFEEILAEYPDLELDDIKQSLQYAALLTWEAVYPV